MAHDILKPQNQNNASAITDKIRLDEAAPPISYGYSIISLLSSAKTRGALDSMQFNKEQFLTTAKRFRSTVWFNGWRQGRTRGARHGYYRAASLRAAHAARPLEPVLGGLTYAARHIANKALGTPCFFLCMGITERCRSIHIPNGTTRVMPIAMMIISFPGNKVVGIRAIR